MKKAIVSIIVALMMTITVIPLMTTEVNALSWAENPGGTWVWPVQPTNPTTYAKNGYSQYITLRCGTYYSKMNGYHKAIDITPKYSTKKILAARSGTVLRSEWNNSLGNYITIKHSGGYYSVYAHLSSRYVSSGTDVIAGQTIGVMGDTGDAFGEHLHFQINKEPNGWAIGYGSSGTDLVVNTNPSNTMKYVSGLALVSSNDPVTGKNIISWNKYPNATKYKIYAKKGNGKYKRIRTTKGLSFKHTSAIGTWIYYYRVKAYNKRGKVLKTSNTVARVCDLARPSIRSITNDLATGKIIGKFRGVKYANRYVIYRSSTGPTGTYNYAFEINRSKLDKGGESLSFVTGEGTPGTVYYYKIMADNTKWQSEESSLSSCMGKTLDLASTRLSVTTNDKGQPVLTWTPVPNASRYAVYRAPKGSEYSQIATVTDITVTNTLYLVAGTTYCYKVVAICDNNANGNSASSNVVIKYYDPVRSLESEKPNDTNETQQIEITETK